MGWRAGLILHATRQPCRSGPFNLHGNLARTPQASTHLEIRRPCVRSSAAQRRRRSSCAERTYTKVADSRLPAVATHAILKYPNTTCGWVGGVCSDHEQSNEAGWAAPTHMPPEPRAKGATQEGSSTGPLQLGSASTCMLMQGG